ncbi:MAG: D-alanine--D-alanine ligase, partial [Alterinioella nitratireducens]|uniref:D-alanine--D-alanine ligase n=1 Tax=Alterinioella nitratireducens TaxID=2735915 RepID=UPI00405922CF
ALAMDKQRSKATFRAAGIPVADSLIAAKPDVMARHMMDAPYVVKPNNEGSSVGVYLVMEGENSPPQLGAEMPDQVMVETYAPGRELTTTVMGDRALGVTDILTDGWYDYDAKYKPGGSRHVVPADIPAPIYDACMEMAVTAHDALGCRGLSRIDYRWDEAQGLDGLIVLEVNTQPGMTPTSLSPEQGAAVGISFGRMCAWMVEDASCDR